MNAHKTAISRIKLSAPMRYLQENGYLGSETILDYGCGKGTDADILNIRRTVRKYDPHFFPRMPGKTFPLVTCHYVLNVVKQPGRVLGEAWKYVRGKGRLAVSVRGKLEIVQQAEKSNWKKSGSGYITGTGTYQRGFTIKELVKFARGLDRVRTIEEIKLPGSSAVMVVIHKV